MSVHAQSSPSGAEGWMHCAGWLSSGESSKYADEGTDAHELASRVLECPSTDVRPEAWQWIGTPLPKGHVVDEKMATAVQKYVDLVRSLPGKLLVEQSLPLEPITGEKGAQGTGDAVLLDFDSLEITVVDLKYGTGIQVNAENNPQLMHYGLAAMLQYEQFAPWKLVRGIISQPRRDHVSEAVYSRADLLAFRKDSKRAAKEHRRLAGQTVYTLWDYGALRAGKKTCRWCVRKDPCPEYARMKLDENKVEFSPI